jgi:hypothetical protein
MGREEGMKMPTIGEPSPDLDPRHVFLDATAVMARYGWGKTKGYQNLKNRDLIPAPVMVHPNRWRLDQLLSWEERRIALTETVPASVGPRPIPRLVDMLPQPKRAPHRSS